MSIVGAGSVTWGRFSGAAVESRAEADRQVDSDEALMLRVGRGDQAAFAELARRHTPRMLGLARRMGLTAHDAEEVVQEAFLRIWRHAGRWQPQARLTTWLYRVVTNLCIDHRRLVTHVPLDAVADPVDPAPGVVETLEREQTNALVARTLDTLPTRQRAALVLCYYEGLSNAEAAAALSVSVSALESLLVRGRRSLSEQLGHLGGCSREGRK